MSQISIQLTHIDGLVPLRLIRDFGIPPILLTSIARNSPDALSPMMWLVKSTTTFRVTREIHPSLTMHRLLQPPYTGSEKTSHGAVDAIVDTPSGQGPIHIASFHDILLVQLHEGCVNWS